MRSSTFFLALAIVALFASRSARSAPRPPNIVFILVDDMGWRDIGCNGSKFYETPNIDALAARGMRFTNAYAACPVCSPTRASILTGQYPARLHLTDWIPGQPDLPTRRLLHAKMIDHLPLDLDNIPKTLKVAGFHSAAIGKWHLGGGEYLPQHQGFDLNVGGTHTGSPPGGYFNFKTPTMSAASPQEYLTDRLTDEAERFMADSKDDPFFLYLSHYAVHIPLQAKEKLEARYRDKAHVAGDPQDNVTYAAMVQSVDEGVGSVIAKIDELGLADNTMIVFFSDNGGLSVKEGPKTPSTSNAPLRAGKGYLYEGGIREPLIVVYPHVIKPGTMCDVPVISTDFLPTILELAGRPVPAPASHDGVSLWPLLKGKGSIARDALFWHYPHYSDQGGKPGGAVRQGDWKLIQHYEDMSVELYNLAEDIGEKENLAAREPERAKALTKRLVDWRESVDAAMPRPNPEFGKPTTRPATRPEHAGQPQAGKRKGEGPKRSNRVPATVPADVKED